jgi:D-arginine dehydrogenase
MKTADAIIIGGGIAGHSLAATLGQSIKTVVLEMEKTVGYHATGRSAAIYIKNYGNRVLRALNARSEPFLQNPGPFVGDTVLSPRGELLIASEDELSVLESYFNDSDGLERLTPAEVQELVPILKIDDVCAAVFEPRAQDIDVDRLMQGFGKQARANGVHILTDHPVTSIFRDGHSWVITTRHETFSTPIIINAAGAWGDHVAGMAKVLPLGLQPMRRSAVMMAVPPQMDCMAWPLFGTVSEQWYAKPTGGKLMISPADEDPIDAQDAYPDDMTLAEGLWRFEQATTVPMSRPSNAWAGLRTFLPDRTPAVGFDPSADGFFWLVGQGGYGVQTCPAMAELAASIILGQTPHLASDVVSALSPKRFR